MSMLEQLRDDASNEWSGQCQTRLYDEAVGDTTVAIGHVNQDSFVSPSALQPGTRTLDKAIPLLDVLQRERVSVERNHAEHQKPASEDRLSRNWGCWQRVVLRRIRHVDERVKLEVDTLHRGHRSPNLIALRGESGDNLDLDRTAHGFSMTKPQQRRSPSDSASFQCCTRSRAERQVVRHGSMTTVTGDGRPLLVLISGSPGSGKSTLGRLLSKEMRLPHLNRDEIWAGLRFTHQRGASDDVLVRGIVAEYGALEHLLAVGVSLIADGTLYRGEFEANIRRLQDLAQVVNLHVRSSRASQRFEERELALDQSAEDLDRKLDKLQEIQDLVSEPLDLTCQTIEITNEDDFEPSVEQIISELHQM